MLTYPQDNRAESLDIDYFLIRRRVSHAMHGVYNWAELTAVQREEVDETIDSGLRMYYYPPPLPPPFAITMNLVHEWSFMRPVHEFTTVAGERTYPLPPNFERPIDGIFYQAGEEDYRGPIPFTNPTMTMKLESRQEEQSPPRWASYRSDQSTGQEPQQQVLDLHPTPDSTYKCMFQYQAVGRRLTEDQPYPLGGQIHGPGILAACLAAVEERLTGAQGPRYMTFLSVLAGNIARDDTRNAAILGYNGNNRPFQSFSRGDLRDNNGIFYQDVDYGGYMS